MPCFFMSVESISVRCNLLSVAFVLVSGDRGFAFKVLLVCLAAWLAL